MKNNPDLLQESEVENAGVDLTAGEGKINEDDYNMKISTEEEQETVKYQNTLKLDVENITKNKKIIWRPIYEVISYSCAIFEDFFQNLFRLM